MKADRLRIEEVDVATRERLFEWGAHARVFVAPLVLLGAMTLLALDPAAWRTWVIIAAVVFGCGRLGFEVLRTRRLGIAHLRLSVLLSVPAVMLTLVVASLGGVDSPLVVMMPVLTVFLSVFFRPRAGVFFAAVGTVLVWCLALVASQEWVPTLTPAVFGGGPRGSVTDLLLVSRGTVLTIALWLAAFLGRSLSHAFQSAIQRSLDARDELLTGHVETTKRLATLVTEVAHELKNPLASVKGLSALLARAATGKERDRVTMLRGEVDRVQEILESLLNFSRPLVPLDVGPVALATVVEQCAALHDGVARERGVSIRLDVRPEVVVSADERKVRQIVFSLVQNALAVTGRGGAIDLVVGGHGGAGKVTVMVRGPGEVDAERAFETSVGSGENTHGLGLTLARLAARQHGGDVRLLSREGGGLVAEFSLPGPAR